MGVQIRFVQVADAARHDTIFSVKLDVERIYLAFFGPERGLLLRPGLEDLPADHIRREP